MDAHEVQQTLRDLVEAVAAQEEPDPVKPEVEDSFADPFLTDDEDSAILSALGSVARLIGP